MPRLMITCPTTNKAVPTGMSMDQASFENPTNTMENNSSQCAACGQMHTWSKADAFLEDA